jgi:hypothetical protein
MANLEPVKIEILLRETISKGMQEAIQSFKDTEDGAKNASAAIKKSIAEEQQHIKAVTADLKYYTQLQKEANTPSAKAAAGLYPWEKGNNKEANLGVIQSNKELAASKANLIKLQNEQINGNKKEEGSQGGMIAGLGKWAIGLASVTGALAIGKSIMESFEPTAHALEQGIAAASSATGYFFKTIASGDWSNFNDGMQIAIKGAIEYVNKMEEVNNLANQDKIQSAEFDKKIAQEREKTYDKGSGNNQERLGAYQNMIGFTEQKFDGLIETASLKYKALLDKASSDTGGKTSTDEIDTFISKYRSLQDMLEEGEKYNKLAGVKLTTTQQGFNPTIGNEKQYAAAQTALKAMGEEGRKAGEKAFNIGKIIFPVRDALADVKAKLIGLEASKEQGNTFVKRSMGALENKMKLDAVAAAKKAKEDAELDNRIKATAELLKNANDGERDAIAKRLVLLEQEKKLIEWKNEAAKAMAANKPLKPIGADTALGAIREAAKASGIDLDKLKLKDTDLEVDKIKRGNSAREAEANRLRKKYNIEDKKDTKELAENYYAVADAADMLSNAIGDSNAGLADMLKGVGSVAGQMGNLVKAGAFDKMGEDGMSQGDAISSAVSGTTQLIGIVVGAAAERKRVMEEYYASIIAQQQQYNLLLNDQLRLNSDINGSVFFTNYEGKLNDSTKAFNDATSKYNEETKKFATSEAITGKKNVVSGANVIGGIGAGAAAGAGIGALLGGGVLSVPAAAVGAVIGSVVGLFTGLFAKKKKDVVAPLLETYKDLISPAGEFNEVLAKTLIANNKVTEATKATLQNLIDWKEQAKLAREQLTAVIKDLTGGLGDDLRNALVGAFTDGTDAATAFGDSVNNVLENVMSNMIFNKVFEGAFKQLEDGMNASYGIGPDGKPMTGSKVDGKWADDLKTFFDQSKGLTDQFNQGLADAKAEAAANGMAIFGKDTSAGGATGMKGDIARMTEETGSALSGNITAIRINMARMIESGNDSMTMLQRSLELQARTADNTDVMSKTLNNIDTRLSRIELDGLKVK